MEQASRLVRHLEAEYIANSEEGAWEAWIAAQDAINQLDASKADGKLFFLINWPFMRRGNRRLGC